MAMTNTWEKNLREEAFILAEGFTAFSPSLGSSIAFSTVARQKNDKGTCGIIELISSLWAESREKRSRMQTLDVPLKIVFTVT
jgi:hypothetical protein